MRKLAGYHGNTKLYFNTRTAVEPPMELLRSTPIGLWVYDANEAVMNDSRAADRPTTVYVIRFFMEMNRIFLQDAAAMLALFPERSDHAMFRDIALFSSIEFAVSCSERTKYNMFFVCLTISPLFEWSNCHCCDPGVQGLDDKRVRQPGRSIRC
jgi:hypothetical protein